MEEERVNSLEETDVLPNTPISDRAGETQYVASGPEVNVLEPVDPSFSLNLYLPVQTETLDATTEYQTSLAARILATASPENVRDAWFQIWDDPTLTLSSMYDLLLKTYEHHPVINAEVDRLTEGTLLHRVVNQAKPEAEADLHLLKALDANFNCLDREGQAPLHCAVKDSRVELIPTLVRFGADVNLRDAEGRTALIHTCMHGYSRALTLLLQENAEVNIVDHAGWTPLVHLAMNAHPLQMVELLIAHGADPSFWSPSYVPPLTVAARYHPKMCGILLEHGAVVDARGGSWDGTALQAAVISGVPDISVIEMLIREGAEVDAMGGPDGTALIAAINAGYPKGVALLLKQGADPKINYLESAQRSNKQPRISVDAELTAVGYAVTALEYSFELVKLLLDAGSRLGTITPTGRTLLEAASRNRSARLVSLLIEKGLPPNQPSIDGVTPLQGAATGGSFDRAEKIQLLLGAGADVLARCDKSRNVLHYISLNEVAHSSADEKPIRILLDAGADPSAADADGSTPLHVASQRGRLKLVSELLASAGNSLVHAADNLRRTPLHLASRSDHEEVVAILLGAGADANCTDCAGRTPLHLAVEAGSENAVRHLLDHGVYIGTRDRPVFGYTAADLAAANGRIGVLQLLREQAHVDGVKARAAFMKNCLFVYFPCMLISFLVFCLYKSHG